MDLVAMVDDSSFQRRQMCKLLSNLGVEVKSFSSGKDLITSVEVDQYLCIFSDLLMPEMDGVELTTLLRDMDSKIPIFIVSANIQQTIKNRCYEVGVTEFINKPVKSESLADALEKARAAK